MGIVDIIFRSIFFGYVIWTFIWRFRKRETILGTQVAEIDRFVVRALLIFGILYLAVSMSNFAHLSSHNGISVNQNRVDRAFGNYWFGFWIYPVTYFGLTQLLWIGKIAGSKIPRIAIALIVFGVMHLEKYVLLTVHVHQALVLDRNTDFPIAIFRQIGISWLLNLLIFGFFVILVFKMKNARKSPN